MHLLKLVNKACYFGRTYVRLSQLKKRDIDVELGFLHEREDSDKQIKTRLKNH